MRKPYYDTHEDQEDDDGDSPYDGPSKSQKKRDSEAMQKLGGELTKLPPDQLDKIALPDDIRAAIDDYKKMRSFGAQRRQLQLIGKLMRQLDGQAVREAINRASGESRAAVAALHRAERLREAMLAGDEAVTRFVQENPDTDVQRLRQLVRAARKEAAEGKPPKSARALYRLIYDTALPALDLYAKEDEGGQAE